MGIQRRTRQSREGFSGDSDLFVSKVVVSIILRFQLSEGFAHSLLSQPVINSTTNDYFFFDLPPGEITGLSIPASL